MNVPELLLDDLTWADLVDLARRMIPAASEGQWTLHAPIDPGITLVELFAAELEQRLYVLDRVPDTLVRAVMRLLLGDAAGPRPAQAAVAVLSLATDAGPITVPAGRPLTWAGDGPQRLMLTTEHTVLAVPAASVTRFEVAGTDWWPRLLGGEPVAVFGADGRADAVVEIRAGAPAPEHRFFLAVQAPTVVTGWQPSSAPPPLPKRLAATPPSGLGWVADDGQAVFLDQEGQPLPTADLGALAIPAEHAPRWEALVGDQCWPLRVEDGTGGLRTSGIIRLRPPPDRTFPATLRVRVSRPSPDTPLHRWVSAVAPNAVVARHRRLVQPHPDIATEPLLPLPHREIRLEDAAPNAEQPLDRVLDGRDLASLMVRRADGTEETWSAVDDLAFSGPEDRHLLVVRNAGVLRFGDGSAGRIPHWDRGTRVQRTYWLGAGVPPEIGPQVIFESTAGVHARPVTRLNWGQEPEPAEAARARAAQQLSRSTRGVSAADVEAIAREVPGVGLARVHVEPGLDLAHPGVVVPDAVTVVCVPAVQRRGPADLRAVPAPDLDDWSRSAVAAALEHRRLVGSQLTVSGPAYRRIDVEVALAGLPADSAAVLDRARLALAQFLDPLVGGARTAGWDFGAPVQPADLASVVQRSLGRQGEVSAVRVAEAGGGEWTDCDPLPLRSHELPLLARVSLIRPSPEKR